MADPSFTSQNTSLIGLSNVGFFASPSFADIDGDGDLDAFVGNNDGNTLFFRNNGTASAAVFVNEASNFGITDVGYSAHPSFADIDGDGDQDAFVGSNDGTTLFFRNTGTANAAVFVKETGNFGISDVGGYAKPSFADIDGDGDQDAFVGNKDGITQFFRNTGTANAPAFTGETGNFGITDVGFSASPTFADIDGDGDLDAFVGNLDGNTLFFRNTGTSNAPVFVSEPGNFGIADVGSGANPTFVDIDGDGDQDVFVGESFGDLLYFKNNNLPVLTQPSAIDYTDTKFNDSFATVTGNLSAFDSDGDNLTYGISGGTDLGDGTVRLIKNFGTLTVTAATGAYTFVAKDAAIESLSVNAKTLFSITVSDGLLTDSKALVVQITQAGVTESNGNDTLVGTTGNDSFNALAGNDTINGGVGGDIMAGGLGNDTYVVDNIGDKTIETSTLAIEIDRVLSSVGHTLAANVENLVLTGIHNVYGRGNSLNNKITGNSGNNILNGLGGNDTLAGGLGNDIFRFTTVSKDRITDFSAADDTIQLENGLFTQLTAIGVLSANNFKIGAAADADDYVLYNSATGVLFYDNNGNGVGGTAQIAVLGVGLALTNADFVVT